MGSKLESIRQSERSSRRAADGKATQRRGSTRRRFKRAVARLGEADISNNCPLCDGKIHHGDVILRKSMSSTGAVMVFHTECLDEAVKITDPGREFNELRDKIINTKELFPE